MSEEGQGCLQCALAGGRGRVTVCVLLWSMRTPLGMVWHKPSWMGVSEATAVLPWGGLSRISSAHPSLTRFTSADF